MSECNAENVSTSSILTFDKIRTDVLHIIEQNKVNEITRHSNVHESGVYMIYVDNFTDDTIIPFYIGQTTDFQERHKQHFTDIMALNRLNRECYEYALFADLYYGCGRACKIFSYMVNHGCSLKDLHMIVLEVIEDKKKRIEAEQEYIDSLFAPFFGFNQLNSVIRGVEAYYGDEERKEYSQNEYNMAIDKDAEMILTFSSFGYGVYNWYRSCQSLYSTISTHHPTAKVPDIFLKILECENRLREIGVRRSQIRGYNGLQAEDEAWNICKKTINKFFAEKNLKSEDKKTLVVRVLLFDFENNRKELEKYFEQYSDRGNENIFDIIDRVHGEKIRPIKQKIADNQAEYRALEEEKERLSNIVFGTLLPRQYGSHPLRDSEVSIVFDVSPNEENACYINIEYTCFKSDVYHDFYPNISKIDYYITKEGMEHTGTVYIDNPLSTFFEREDVYYIERGSHYSPFKPFLRGAVDTHIPVSMEYKNGINEWTLKDVQTKDDYTVFEEISSYMDEKTKVFYVTSGSKRTILRFAEAPKYKDLLLIKKLKKCCK